MRGCIRAPCIPADQDAWGYRPVTGRLGEGYRTSGIDSCGAPCWVWIVERMHAGRAPTTQAYLPSPNNVPSLSIITINHASFAMCSCYAIERRDGVGVKEEGGTGVKQDRPLDPEDFC
jgi:hypothetical protein